MHDTAGQSGAGTGGFSRQRPPFAGVTLDAEGIRRALEAGERDFRGSRMDAAHLDELDLSGCQFGPFPDDDISEGAQRFGASAVGARLYHCSLVDANFRYANLSDAVLEDVDVSGATFARADLTGASFGPIVLSDGEFFDAILERVDFCDAQLPRADMSRARLTGAQLGNTDLTGADLYTTTLDGALFSRAILIDANLCDAHGEGVLMEGAVLTRAKVSAAYLPKVLLCKAQMEKVALDYSSLEGADLTSANARGASLQRVNLAFAKCIGADFSNARLQGANLAFAKCMGADFSNARMREAVFSGADCGGANFSNARLIGADLRQADLRGALFSVDTSLAGAQFAGAQLHGIQWRGVDLSETDLRNVKKIRDEAEAKKAKRHEKPERYRQAAEAYGALSTALRQCGLARESVDLHYRSMLMDQRASEFEFKTRLLFLAPRGSGFLRRVRRFLTSPAHLLRWIGTLLLGAIAGYGDKPWRALISYAIVVTAFAAGYFAVSTPTNHPLGVIGSLVLSLTSFHGRGFNSINVAIQSPVAEISALEAMMGAFIELLFVAAFTRRFLGARG